MTRTLVRNVHIGPERRPADVVISDGTVAAIADPGQSADGMAVLDGAGGTLLPGLVDAHVHMAQWASTRRRIPLASARSATEAVALVAAGATADGWVFGANFSDGLWTDVPHKDLLERALPGRPAALFSNDLHTLWLSPAALKEIGREHETGVFVEADCMVITAQLPAGDQDNWVLDAAEAAAARGVTGIVDYEMADTVTDWLRRRQLRELPVRVSCAIAKHLLDTAIERGHRTGDEVPGTDGMLRIGPYKLFVDGSLNTRTAYCHDPYPGNGHGALVLPPEELLPLMRRAAEHGITPAVHAIGDLANEIALDAFAQIGCRGRVEHAQLVADKEFHRFAELGVIASVQPAHAPDDRDVADRYWPGRTGRAFAYAALLAAGATLEIGSDAPVAPLDPWDGIASAVSRSDDDRPSWHPEQAIPVGTALAAASGGRDRVRVGDPADLLITARDPYTTELRDMPIVLTMVGGRTTHRGPTPTSDPTTPRGNCAD